MSELVFVRRFGVALAVMGPLLAGCSSSSLSSISAPSFSSLFGSSSSSATTGSGAQANALTLPPNFDCPPVQVREGAATLSNPPDANATSLRYQVSIGNTARECRASGGMVAMKVGMQGRVILGPQGVPGRAPRAYGPPLPYRNPDTPTVSHTS